MKPYTKEELDAQRKRQLAKQDASNERGDCKFTVVAEMFVAQAAADTLSEDGGTQDSGYSAMTNLLKVAQDYSGLTKEQFRLFLQECAQEAGV